VGYSNYQPPQKVQLSPAYTGRYCSRVSAGSTGPAHDLVGVSYRATALCMFVINISTTTGAPEVLLLCMIIFFSGMLVWCLIIRFLFFLESFYCPLAGALTNNTFNHRRVHSILHRCSFLFFIALQCLHPHPHTVAGLGTVRIYVYFRSNRTTTIPKAVHGTTNIQYSEWPFS